MTAKDLKSQVLRLSARERAELVEVLVTSLADEPDADHLRVWLEEARRRQRELESDPSQGTPATEVFREADARLR